MDRLKNSPATEVVVTNTLPITDDKRFDKLTVLSIAPLLSRAIQEVFAGRLGHLACSTGTPERRARRFAPADRPV